MQEFSWYLTENTVRFH